MKFPINLAFRPDFDTFFSVSGDFVGIFCCKPNSGTNLDFRLDLMYCPPLLEVNITVDDASI